MLMLHIAQGFCWCFDKRMRVWIFCRARSLEQWDMSSWLCFVNESLSLAVVISSVCLQQQQQQLCLPLQLAHSQHCERCGERSENYSNDARGVDCKISLAMAGMIRSQQTARQQSRSSAAELARINVAGTRYSVGELKSFLKIYLSLSDLQCLAQRRSWEWSPVQTRALLTGQCILHESRYT